MSGAEFIVVAGVISSIIAIVDGINQVVDAASEVEGLPKAFRQASTKLPLVRDILEATKHNFEADNVSGVEKSVTLVVADCKGKWEMLNGLFDKVIPEERASRVERYYKAVKTLGKGGKVESLMKGILEDIQLLTTIKTMTTTNVEKVIKTVTAAQEDKVAKAITDVAAWQPSVPDNIFQEGGASTNISSGRDTYSLQGEARLYQSGGGPMTINDVQTIINSALDINLLQSPKKDKARACLNELFLTYPRDDRAKLMQAKGSRVDGTCEWIKTNKLYNSWIHSHSQLLWVSGGPGKGKTMLSIFLAEELERIAKDSQGVLFLQYFCDNKDEKRNTAVAILRGMIFQLLELRPKFIDYILPSFEIQNKSLFTASSFETLWRIFENMLRDRVLGTTYCILDGLDECDEASLEVLLENFRALFLMNPSPFHLKLIVVSRDLPDFIPEILSSFPRIQLDPDADTQVKNDIYRFIEVKVNELSVFRQYSESLCMHVKETFQNRAQGTFLWIGIVAKVLRKYKATEVREALDLFPPGLDELYARILLQIDINRRETAAKILRWTVMAVRPLTLSELSVAIDVKPSIGLSREEVMEDQVSYCGYFLTIKDDEVSLIHQSAKDYLLRKSHDSNPELENFRVKEDIGNLEIARKCFYYLQNGALANSKVDLEGMFGPKDISRLKDFPLLSYATIHWPEHARSLARSEDIFSLSLPFYDKNSPVRETWLKTYWAMGIGGIPPHSFTLLDLASFFGILPLAENLVLKKGWINRVKRLLYGILPFAENYVLKKGWINRVNRLLYVNQRGGDGSTALSWAAQGGHKAVVQLLLDNGADVEAKSNYRWTALLWAARGGHEAVVRQLLDKGADVEAGDENGETALIWAVRGGYEAVVRQLLDKGADVEAKNRRGWTVLIWAARGGHEAVVRQLLDKGTDVEAKDRLGRTALIWAARGGHEAVVRQLLNKGADIEAKDGRGETALI